MKVQLPEPKPGRSYFPPTGSEPDAVEDMPPRASGAAVSALIFGISGFLCGIGGVIGIVLGIMVLVQQSKPNADRAGRGVAISGIVTGAVSAFVFPFVILSAIYIPIFLGAQNVAKRPQCLSNMKNLGTALNIYCADNDGMLPSSAIHTGSKEWNADGFVAFAMYKSATDGKPTLNEALSKYTKSTDIMWCPSDKEPRSNPHSRVSYYYKAAVDRSWFDGKGRQKDFKAPAEQVVFWERNEWHMMSDQDGPVDGANLNMLFADGHVSTMVVMDSGYTERAKPPTPLPELGKGEPAWFNRTIDGSPGPSGLHYDITKYKDALGKQYAIPFD